MEKDQTFRNWRQDDPRFNESEAWPSPLFPEADYHYFRDCGCLICSLAIMLRLHHIEEEDCEDRFNPWILNQRLIECGAFSPGADLYMDMICKLYPIEYGGYIRYSREMLIRLLKDGALCLITVRGKIGVRHYVVFDKLAGDDVMVIDPDKGSRLLSTYANVFEIRPFFRIRPEKDRPPGFKPKIALTFDDGPSEIATGRILTALEEAGALATFFVEGRKAACHAGLLKRMAEKGHQLGIHTWGHDLINHMDEKELRENIQKTSDVIYKAAQVRPTVMRPPGGSYNNLSLQVLKDMGLPVVMWSIDPRDWQTLDVEATVNHVLRFLWDGCIILMHDVYEETAEAAQILIPEIAARGFDLVTVDELVGRVGGLKAGDVVFRCGDRIMEHQPLVRRGK